MPKLIPYEPDITVEEIEKSKTFLKIGISEVDRLGLWYELRDMMDIFKQKGKNKERSFKTQFPIAWEVMTKIRVKGEK